MADIKELYIGMNTEDLPTISVGNIEGSAINTFALVGKFERGAAVQQITSSAQIPKLLGSDYSSMNGSHVLKSIFKTLNGVSATGTILRLIPSDAVAASKVIQDSALADCIQFYAGQKGKKDFGIWGNRVGILVVASSRGNATLSAPTSTADDIIMVDSTAPFEVGDYITVGNATPFRAEIIAIDEMEGILTLATTVPAIKASGDAVKIDDFSLMVYLKDPKTGAISEPEETWLNLNNNPNSSHYIFEAINDPESGSSFITLEHVVGGSNLNLKVTTNSLANVVYLAGGENGTDSFSDSQVAAFYPLLNDFEFMYITQCEVFTDQAWADLEAYCAARKYGKSFSNPPKGLTYAQSLAWARKKMKSRKVFAASVREWVEVDFPTAKTAKKTIVIPSAGFYIGYAIWKTSNRGIHHIPAGLKQEILGIISIDNAITSDPEDPILTDKFQMKELLNYGLNCISEKDGSFYFRGGRTHSKLPEWRFINALSTVDFLKSTFTTAFAEHENEIANPELLKHMQIQANNFMLSFYNGSSNGGNEKGLASYITKTGSESSFKDVCIITIMDREVNPASQMSKGLVRGKIYITPAFIAERILLGFGLTWNF